MSNPTPYEPGYEYSGVEPIPGNQLDNDFANLQRTTDELIGALADIRRSDGALNNGVVTVDSLSDDIANQIIAEVNDQVLALAEQVAQDAAASEQSATDAADSASAAQTHAEASQSSADSAMQWAAKMDGPVSGSEYSAKYWAQVAAAANLPPKFRGDGTVAATTTTVTLGPRVLRDAANLFDLTLSSSLTKTLQTTGAWTAGSGANGLATGARTANTWYHLFLIRNDSTGAIDACFDTSVAAANRPAGWTAYRRVWSVRTNAANEIQAFIKFGADRNFWAVRYSVVNNASMSYGDLVDVVHTPTGVRAIAQLTLSSGTAANGIFMSLTPVGATPGAIQLQHDFVRSSAYQQIASIDVPVSASRQVGFYSDTSPVTGVYVSCKGYIELFED